MDIVIDLFVSAALDAEQRSDDAIMTIENCQISPDLRASLSLTYFISLNRPTHSSNNLGSHPEEGSF